METLISPWLMYALAITSAVNTLAWTCLFFTGVMSYLFLQESCRLSRRGWIITGIVAFISFLILIFVPNKQEMIAIIAANTITSDNFPMDMQEYITKLVKVCGAVR